MGGAIHAPKKRLKSSFSKPLHDAFELLLLPELCACYATFQP
jgi:hypothetical protein